MLTSLVNQPALAAHHHVTVKHAAYVDLSHPGIHTHENKIIFATGKISLQSKGLHHLKLQAHSVLPTWTPGYGNIENWNPDVTGKYQITVYVPSQLVDFVTTAKNLAPNKLKQYYSQTQYSLDIDWDD